MPRSAVLVGYGYWGKNIARNLHQSLDFELFAVIEENDELRTQAEEAYPGAKFFSSISHYLSFGSKAEVGFVATSASTHFEIASVLISHDHHIWVEKPVTLNSNDGFKLKELATKYKKILIVDHTYLYAPAIKRMLSEITLLGNVISVNSIRNGFGKVQEDTNVLWDLAVHDIAILELILNQKANTVQAIPLSTYLGKVTSSQLIISYDRTIASINSSWLSPLKVRDFYVLCEKGFVFFDEIDVAEKIKILKQHVEIDSTVSGKQLVNYRLGDTLIPEIANEEPLSNALKNFHECINENTQPISNIDLSLRVLAILEAADRSLNNESRKEIVNYASTF